MGKFSRLGNALYDGTTSVDFIGRKWLWYAISGVIVAISLGGLLVNNLNLGIEFEGGVEISVSLPADQMNQDGVDELIRVVQDTGIEEAASPKATSGEQFIRIRTESMSNADTITVREAIVEKMGIQPGDVSTTEIGASWGEQVADRAITGLVVFLILVVLFIWGYFREWKMSVAALAALVHDIIITVGIYALSGFEVTPATVTGLLTILGFSLYDTVVVFDKVRENTRDLGRSRRTYAELANLAVNQTLVRSINTSIVALLPVGALLYVSVFGLGAGSLKDLALSLFVGMAVGLYSSVFIATPLLVHLKSGEREVTKQDARAKARSRRDIDKYADVPVFTEDMPVVDAPEEGEEGAPRAAAPFQAPTSRPTATGSGRVVPETKSPVAPSGSAHRPQPTKQPRSKRGK